MPKLPAKWILQIYHLTYQNGMNKSSYEDKYLIFKKKKKI
jgi:hypothetical protein